MANQWVSAYRASWNTAAHKGTITLTLYGPGSRHTEISVDDRSEMRLLLDLLRNEGPWHWDRSTRVLSTLGVEIPGEGED